MAVMKSPANKSGHVGPTRTQPTAQKMPSKNQSFSQYRESSGGHSGRTSSGKTMTGPKAGRGSTC